MAVLRTIWKRCMSFELVDMVCQQKQDDTVKEISEDD
jgi:hypothetical protein